MIRNYDAESFRVSASRTDSPCGEPLGPELVAEGLVVEGLAIFSRSCRFAICDLCMRRLRGSAAVVAWLANRNSKLSNSS
jgi:hypothetical protein